MAGSKYYFCNGCEHRKDTKRSISCPADFNPYDDAKCPRHARFMTLERNKQRHSEQQNKVKFYVK